MKLSTILFIGAGAVGLYYLPTILGLYNMEVSIIQVLPSKIEDKIIHLIATVKLKNKTGVRISIQRIGADITFNGKKIAQFEDVEPMVVQSYGETNFNIEFSIDAESFGQELWSQFLAQNLQNFEVAATGMITANNKSLPFQTTYTMKDFVNGN